MRLDRRLENLPSIYGRWLDYYWRRCYHRSRCYHRRRGNNDRSRGYNRRSGSDNNGRRSNDIAHDGGGSKRRSSDSPSAVVTVMMVVVMMTRHMMMARGVVETRSAMEAMSTMMSTGTGECETCHSHCCDNYCQFLVHVFPSLSVIVDIMVRKCHPGNLTKKNRGQENFPVRRSLAYIHSFRTRN